MDIPTHRANAGGSPTPAPSRRKRAVGWIAVLTICSLVVASIVVWYAQSPPPAIARQYLSDQGVASADDLELVGYQDHGVVPVFPFPKNATVEFRVKGAESRKKLEVELSRTVYFLPWHATGFREKADK